MTNGAPGRAGRTSWRTRSRRLLVAAVLAVAPVLVGGGAQADEPQDLQTYAELAQKAEWWLADGYTEAAAAAKGGEGVKVCLIDSGVDKNHPDFKGARFEGGTDLSGKGAPDGLKPLGDDHDTNHGTTMAGWIVGQGHGKDHKLGVMGVAPKATLMSVSTATTDTEVEQGIRYCSDNGAKVISLSNSYFPTEEIMAYALDHDVVLVVSTTNDDYRRKGDRRTCAQVGGRQYGMLTITGSGKGGIEDPQTCMNGDSGMDRHEHAQGRWYTAAGVAMEAPSGGAKSDDPTYDRLYDLVTVVPSGKTGFGQGNTYHENTGGASMATAMTSGVVALVRAAHPDLDAANTINRMISTGKKPASGEALGADSKWGFGIVDPVKAVKADVPTVDKNPLGDPRTGDQGLWTGSDPGKTTAPTRASLDDGSSSASPSDAADSADGDSQGPSMLPWVLGAVGLVAVAGAVLFVLRRRSGA